jgi:hypothetical protein
MESLLLDFADIFEAPRGLPPQRLHDHRIHLLPGTAPVAVRPYRYPQLLKDEVERQCADMLAQGIIRPSTSPFSSPQHRCPFVHIGTRNSLRTKWNDNVPTCWRRALFVPLRLRSRHRYCS